MLSESVFSPLFSSLLEMTSLLSDAGVANDVTGAGMLNDGDVGSTIVFEGMGVEFKIVDCSSIENEVREGAGLLKRKNVKG